MLARGGADVTLVCRGAHLAAVRSQGLRLVRPTEEFTVRTSATDAPAEVGPVDVIIHSTKLYDLAESSLGMRPMIGRQTLIVPIQNGVTAPQEIGAIVGAQHVAGGLVFINCMLEAPGVAHSRSAVNELIFGELDGRVSERVARFRDVCMRAGIEARAVERIEGEQWRKFIPVAGFSAIACLARQPIGPVLADPALAALYRQAMDEVAALAAARGVALESDVVERMLALQHTYRPDAKVSMLEDLEAGKPLELEWLSGYVSREARRLGVATPFHDMAYACLKPLARGLKSRR